MDRVSKIAKGNPFDPSTMIGAQASNDQFEKILVILTLEKRRGYYLLEVMLLITVENYQRVSTLSQLC